MPAAPPAIAGVEAAGAEQQGIVKSPPERTPEGVCRKLRLYNRTLISEDCDLPSVPAVWQ